MTAKEALALAGLLAAAAATAPGSLAAMGARPQTLSAREGVQMARTAKGPVEPAGRQAGVQGAPQGVPGLVGAWVQDETTAIVTYRRRYHFKPDGSYEFAFTSRSTGSMASQTLAEEAGRYESSGNRLVLAPSVGDAKTRRWHVERDKYIGNIQLVFETADGSLDIYYRE
jgi:hypothetical protein